MQIYDKSDEITPSTSNGMSTSLPTGQSTPCRDQSQAVPNVIIINNFHINSSGNTSISLQDLSSVVTNTLKQLPDARNGTPLNLKELLVKIQTLIEQSDDILLKPEDKALALEQVEELAIASQKTDPEKQTIGRKALTLLRGTVAALPAAATLVEEINKLILSITPLFGL